MTQGPGTPPYMPPEAMLHNPRYDVKVDIFSYGVMMVHTLCGRWPFPGEPVHANPDNPDDLTPVSEVGRRQEYLDNIPQDHPLMELIHRCLRNSPAHRPDALSVAERVSEVASQSPPSFNNKVEMMDRVRVDAEQREGLRRDNETLTQERDAAINQQEELRRQVDEQERRIESEVRKKDSLRERVEVLSRQKEAEVREKVAKSLEVEDLQLQVAELAADMTRSHDSLARKDEALTEKDVAHQQAFELKDQMHKHALQLKNEQLAGKDHAHVQALQLKDQLHQQALQLKDQELTQKDRAHSEVVAGIERAHREAMALEDQSHQTELQAKQTELTLLRQELASSRDSASQKQDTISRLRNQLRRCRSHLASNQQANLLTTPGAKLVWRECAECPFATGAALAVVINGIVYVGGGECNNNAERCIVCRYHPGEDKWATLPPSPVKRFGIGQVSGQLVLIGGRIVSTNLVTDDVHVFDKESQQWEKSIPAMPTARVAPSVVSHSTVLVACGGRNVRILPTVELYSSEASQWYQCPPLPSPHFLMSSVAIGDTLFLVGGFTKDTPDSATKSVFSASLSTLIDRAIHYSTGSAHTQQLWTTLKEVQYYRSTAASIGGCLLALGGMDRPVCGQTSASIHIYLPTSCTWHQTGELPLPLHRSAAVLLPTNELLIIGGFNKDGNRVKHVCKESVEV